MTDEQVKEQIDILRSATKKASKNKKTAIKFLRDAGIPIGDEPFGSKKKKVSHA